MKQYIFFLLIFSGLALGQSAVRIGPQASMSTVTIPGVSQKVVTVQAPVTVHVCNYPANAVPCTNYAQTFQSDAGTAGIYCPTNQQVVLDGTTSCVTPTDSLGNWGAWVLPGNYAVTLTLANGTSAGPLWFSASAGGGSSSGGTITIPGAISDLLFNDGNSPPGLGVDSGKILVDKILHYVKAYGFQGINSTAQFLLQGVPSAGNCTAGPNGQIQLCFGPGPDANLSYSADGPFSVARWGTIGGSALALPGSRYYPLNADNAMPLGSLGDVGLNRFNPGVAYLVNPASLATPSKFCIVATYPSETFCLNYNAGRGTYQLTVEKTGGGGFHPIEICASGGASCAGWEFLAGATPGMFVPTNSNAYDIGGPSTQARNVFAGSGFIDSGEYMQTYTNDNTGTQIGMYAVRGSVTDGNGKLEVHSGTTSDTTNIVGVVVGESAGGTCGVSTPCTTGVAYVAFRGRYASLFDGSTTIKHWAIASTSTAGNLTDSQVNCGTSLPTNVDQLGCIETTNTGAGTYMVDLEIHRAEDAPVTFSSLATCTSALEGRHRALTDSNTATFNATAAGGGANHVDVRCNGSNWVVY